MNSIGVNGESRIVAAARRRWRVVERRAGPGRRVADVVVVGREHDEALRRDVVGGPAVAAAAVDGVADR